MSNASVAGRPRIFLRVEGIVLFIGGVWAFTSTDEPWWLLPTLLFLPDLFMVGYARSARLGALIYNLAHAYPVPAALGAASVLTENLLAPATALIWFAHIGMDRALGYGLKYDTAFRDTHLGRIGRPREEDRPQR